jgi:hypothetical protein
MQYAPRLIEQDYGPMRELLEAGELPRTFAEWQEADERQWLRWKSLGNTVQQVDVTSAELSEFCFERGWPRNLISLDRLAWHKMMRGSHHDGPSQDLTE